MNLPRVNPPTSPNNNGSAKAATLAEPIPEATFSTYQNGSSDVNRAAVDPTYFPAQLRTEQIWCNWRYETRKDGKLTKVPYRGLYAKAYPNDPATWITLECAQANLATPHYKMDGIGCFVNKGRVWVDLDKCIKDGVIEPWAKVIDKFGTYTELSLSGNGVHCYGLGEVKEGRNINGCEIYGERHFFTVTGKQIPGTPRELCASDHLADIYRSLVADTLRPYQLKKDSAANGNGSKPCDPDIFTRSIDLNALERGENPPGKSQSEGDYALVGEYIERGFSNDKIRDLIRASGRMRDTANRKVLLPGRELSKRRPQECPPRLEYCSDVYLGAHQAAVRRLRHLRSFQTEGLKEAAV